MSDDEERDDEDDEKVCANPSCDCLVHTESDFCSNSCADADSEGRCHCQHKGCKGRRSPHLPRR